MAIESVLELEVPGLPNPIEVQGGYSRILSFEGAAGSEAHVLGTPQTPKVSLRFGEWANKDAAEKIYEPESSKIGESETQEYEYSGPGELSFVEKKRVVGVAYDPQNPDHVAQYEAAGKPSLEEIDAHGNPWMVTEEQLYFEVVETLHVWRGKTAQPMIRERKVDLPLEQALQVVAGTVPGKNPQETYDTLASKLYRAAMLSGLFKEAKIA